VQEEVSIGERWAGGDLAGAGGMGYASWRTESLPGLDDGRDKSLANDLP
jgi:hypothetical protein